MAIQRFDKTVCKEKFYGSVQADNFRTGMVYY